MKRKTNTIFDHSPGRVPGDCAHCSGGTCDPTTGACVKGKFQSNFSGYARDESPLQMFSHENQVEFYFQSSPVWFENVCG